jgi:hypothetical protein
MGQQIPSDSAQETHHNTLDDNLSTSATLDSPSDGDGVSGYHSDESESSEFIVPPAPPPSRENSLADRRRNAGQDDFTPPIYPGLVELVLHGFLYDDVNFESTLTDSLRPSTSMELPPDPERGSQDGNQGEEQGVGLDHGQFNWLVGEPDPETERLWQTALPDDGRWNVEVVEEEETDLVQGQTVAVVAVLLTEAPTN